MYLIRLVRYLFWNLTFIKTRPCQIHSVIHSVQEYLLLLIWLDPRYTHFLSTFTLRWISPHPCTHLFSPCSSADVACFSFSNTPPLFIIGSSICVGIFLWLCNKTHQQHLLSVECLEALYDWVHDLSSLDDLSWAEGKASDNVDRRTLHACDRYVVTFNLKNGQWLYKYCHGNIFPLF